MLKDSGFIKVLIVAECNVNRIWWSVWRKLKKVLIVAECNVNVYLHLFLL